MVVINDFSYVVGGAAQVALMSAVGLATRGYRVILLSAVGPNAAALKDAGVEVICTHQHDVLEDPNRMRAAMQGIWNVRARRAIRDLLRSLDSASTIVHLHSWTKALSSSVVREAVDRDFTVVCTLHDYFAACPNGGFFDFQARRPCGETALSFGCISRNCDSRSYSQKLWRVARQVVQRLAGEMPRGIRHFICVSEFSERILRQYLPATSTIDHVVNPIDAVKDMPTDVGANHSFLFVGRLAPEKGALTFAQAAVEVGIVPVFVGDGPEVEKIRMVCPKAHVTGWLSHGEVAQQMRAARALIMPSLWFETQGLVVSEAAALGVPAIVSDRCAARESVIDGQTGLWFAGGDSLDLAQKITKVSQSATAAALGRRAYEAYWETPMTIDRHVYELEKLFGQYLRRRVHPVESA